MSKEKITVMIADDHMLMREGLKQLLELENDIDVIAQAGDGEEAIAQASEYNPDVVLLDINMPRMNGIDTLKRFKDLGIDSKVIMLTIHEDREYLYETMKIGANGYLLKDSDAGSLINAIKGVHKGQTYIQPSIVSLLVENMDQGDGRYNEEVAKIELLTKREYEVLTLIAEGLDNRTIANKLYISEKTVKNHVSSILKKLDVNNRIQAAIFAFKTNIKKI